MVETETTRPLTGNRRSGSLLKTIFAGALLTCSAWAAPADADCTMGALGVTPLTDMASGALYKGYTGGLYPNGTSIPPAAHLNAALGLAAQIVPINNRIVVLGLGISNAANEWAAPPGTNTCPSMPASVKATTFKSRATADLARNSKVTIVDGCVGGPGLDATALADPNNAVWAQVTTRLANAGISNAAEVQVVWLKTALLSPSNYGAFPGHATFLRDTLKAIANNIKSKYPNTKLAYVSSRTRSYKTGGEKAAFENGFAYKWLIEAQINGDAQLRYDGPSGPGNAPLLLWGPYLWADGPTPRSDGLTWRCNTADPFVGDPFLSDVRANTSSSCVENYDFNHPGGGGIQKVGGELLSFFKTNPTTASWYLKTPALTPSVSISTGGVTGGNAPLTVNFAGVDSTPTHNIVEFAFNFDDGTSTLATSVTKKFNSPGVYTVRMTATDAAGNTSRQSVLISVTSGGGASLERNFLLAPPGAVVGPTELTWSSGAAGSFRFVGAIEAEHDFGAAAL